MAGSRASLLTAIILAVVSLATACGDAESAPVAGASLSLLPRAETVGHTPLPGSEATAARQDIGRSRETAVVRAAERVSPGVVTVNVVRTRQVRVADPRDGFFGGFFGSRTEARSVPSLGSGFIVDAAGVILTNDHVVREADRILVTLPDGRDAEATLVGTDATTDVAVLRIDLPDLPVVPLGRTEDLMIGEWLIAFGNPFGNLISNSEPTATVGVVSALGRHVVPSQDSRGFYLGMIQTDAAINPGNSGGPLVNALGEVVGMNTSIFSRGGGSEGVGFAIPIERVLRIADDLLEHGGVRRAWVGVDVEPEEADVFGRTRGVRVSRISPGSPADLAGLRAGDRIVEANDRRLVSPLDFEALLLDLRAGDAIELRLDARTDVVRVNALEFPSLPTERVTVLRDIEAVTLTPAARDQRGIQSETGALVTGTTSGVREQLGLREGDLIIGVNRQQIRSAEELAELLAGAPPGARVQ
ncbi:MAG: trypsin-like peptidase domain-containing protein, partial [Gemmatimonadota bacterium]